LGPGGVWPAAGALGSGDRDDLGGVCELSVALDFAGMEVPDPGGEEVDFLPVALPVPV